MATPNGIVISPKSDQYINIDDRDDESRRSSLSVSSSFLPPKESKPIVWVLNDQLVPGWGLKYDEYIAFGYGIFGGILTCISGWLIGKSMKYCNDKKQYKWCILEIILRYSFSVALMIIYNLEYENEIFKEEMSLYWGWNFVFIICLLFIMPYMTLIHFPFKSRKPQQSIRSLDK